MAKPTLHVLSPDPIQHAFQVIDLCAKTFGGFYDFRRHLREWYLLNAPYDWQASAIGFVDEQLVTHYGVWDYQMRIGRSVVRCGGIGCVATDGEHRKKGLMAQTIPHSLKQMAGRGYDLSILFGVWDFYHRFGYTRAWSEQTWTINCDHLPADLPKVRYAAMDCRPNPTIAKLHNRANATITGSAVRPLFNKSYCYFHGKPECHVWPNAKKPAGHVMTLDRNGKLICHEATGKPAEILAVLKGLAAAKQFREIGFETLPYNSPLARELRKLTCKTEVQYIKSGGAMVRIMNLQSCLTKMTSELSHRMTHSELAGYRGELTIRSSDATSTLRINKGKVTISDKPVRASNSIEAGHELAQLLIGTDEPLELAEAGKMRLRGEATRLLPVLFPNEHPQLHQADRY